MPARRGHKVPAASVVLGVSRVEEVNTEGRRLSKAVALLPPTGGLGQKPGKGECAPSARLGGDSVLFRLQLHLDLNLSIHQLPWVSTHQLQFRAVLSSHSEVRN